MTTTIGVGDFTITALGATEPVDGQTFAGVACTGVGRLFELTGPGGLRVTVRDTHWAHRERDVVATERHGSPQQFDTLVGRPRLPVGQRGPELYAELLQVRLESNGRGNLFAPSGEDVDEGAGVSVARQLERHGAGRVGNREDLLGDEGRTRARLGSGQVKVEVAEDGAVTAKGQQILLNLCGKAASAVVRNGAATPFSPHFLKFATTCDRWATTTRMSNDEGSH